MLRVEVVMEAVAALRVLVEVPRVLLVIILEVEMMLVQPLVE